MKYLANAFSLGMIDFLHGSDGTCLGSTLEVSALTLDLAKIWTSKNDWDSIVGHEDTARLLTSMLDTKVEVHRVSTSLQHGDKVLVAQYNGPRLPERAKSLPEGSKSLPEGSKIRWYLVEL